MVKFSLSLSELKVIYNRIDCSISEMTMDTIDIGYRNKFKEPLEELVETFLKGVKQDSAQKNKPTPFSAAFGDHLLVLVKAE